MIELTNGLIRVNVPKRDLDAYLELGYEKTKKVVKTEKPAKKSNVEIKSTKEENGENTTDRNAGKR